jgi:hypothetical protein
LPASPDRTIRALCEFERSGEIARAGPKRGAHYCSGVHGYWLPIASDVAISLGGPAGAEDLKAIRDHRSVRRFNELVFDQSDEVAGRSRALIESLTNRR